MTVKRLGAFFAAILLVVGAVLLRDWLDDRSDDATGSDSSGGPTTDQVSGNSFALICSTEFEDVCEALAGANITVTVEPAGTTLDRLAKVDDDQLPDAWLTLDPFPAMLDQTRERSVAGFGPATTGTAPVASTTPIVAVAGRISATFAAACSTPSTATCAGTIGAVEVGISDPFSEASGLLNFANGVAGLVGSTEIDSIQLEESEVRVWVRGLGDQNNAVSTESPLETLINRDSKVNVAYSTTAEVFSNPARPAKPYEILSVEPAFAHVAVFAVMGDDDAALRTQLSTALTAAGWDPAAADATMLSASTFINLRTLWKDTK